MTPVPAAPPHAGLRLAPIDRPKGLLVRLFGWYMRRRFGKVMMPARVIYPRLPGLFWRQAPLLQLCEYGLSIGQALRHLIEVRVSTLNGCTFCADLHGASAALHTLDAAKLAALDDFERDPRFDPRERAALRFVSEVAASGRASDEGFAALKAQFSEREIVEITWLQAFTTYLNRMAVPLGIGSDGFCEILRARP
jgi:AhpD family alkylhydroperoxidase